MICQNRKKSGEIKFCNPQSSPFFFFDWQQITIALVWCVLSSIIFSFCHSITPLTVSVCICGEESWWKSGQFPAAFIFSCGRGALCVPRAAPAAAAFLIGFDVSEWACGWDVCSLGVYYYIARRIYNARAYIIQRGGGTQSLLSERLKRPVNGWLQLLEIVCGGVVCSLWRRVLVFWKVARLICCERRVTPAPLMEVTGALTWCGGPAIILCEFSKDQAAEKWTAQRAHHTGAAFFAHRRARGINFCTILCRIFILKTLMLSLCFKNFI